MIAIDSQCISSDLETVTYSEISLFNKIFPETLENSQKLKEDTVGQGCNETWVNKRKNRITSTNCHRIHMRNKVFETLTDIFGNYKKDNGLPKLVQDALKHGQVYEPFAKEHFQKYMQHTLNRTINIRETGIVIQPYLFGCKSRWFSN